MKLLTWITTVLIGATPDPVNDALHIVSGGADAKVSPQGLVAATETVSPAGGVTATGTTQATALVLTAKRNVITGGASGTGVRLTYTAAGYPQIIANRSGSPKQVWPQSGAAIETVAVNNPINLPDGSTVECFPESSTLWWTR